MASRRPTAGSLAVETMLNQMEDAMAVVESRMKSGTDPSLVARVQQELASVLAQCPKEVQAAVTPSHPLLYRAAAGQELSQQQRKFISKWAEGVSKHGDKFEEMVRSRNAQDPQYSFLVPGGAGAGARYYRACLGQLQYRTDPIGGGGDKQSPAANRSPPQHELDDNSVNAFDTEAFTGSRGGGDGGIVTTGGGGCPSPQLIMPDAGQRRALFRRMDYNSNGGLSLAEIDKAVIELWPHFNHKPALIRAYKAADSNGDGYIKRGEFKKLLHFIGYFTDLWDTFEGMDMEGGRQGSSFRSKVV